MALGKLAVQSSTYFSDVASNAVDGDVNTVACSDMLSTEPWLSVDLGTPMDVDRVEVTNDFNANFGE